MLFPHPSAINRDGVHLNLGRAAVNNCSHSVHFYESDGLFLESLAEFVGGALSAAGACVILATEDHLQLLHKCLAAFGIDPALAAERDQYIALEARQTLSAFMRDGWPDRSLFFETIEPVLKRASNGVRGDSCIVAFGEMVSLLCEEGQYEPAICLEGLWNEIAHRYSISLRCAYPISLFANEEHRSNYQRICSAHGGVIPAESFTRLSSSDGWRMISSLQQQASTLHAVIERRQREIDERLRVEEKLRRTEAFANTIVESSADCVKVLNLDGSLEYMNAAGAAAMEITDPRQVLHKNWIDLWREDDRPRVKTAVNAAARGLTGSFQAECETLAGSTRYWDVKITPARGAHGQIERLIAVSRDITELRAAQLAATHAEKLATAGRMAATIAHEINNPLEAVTNFIYLSLSSAQLPEDVRRYLEIADRELTRVAHIARQTLGFYRSNSTPKLLPVADFVRDALMVYERRLRNKELRVEVSVPQDLKVFGKEGELRQALLNIVANAIDACHAGGNIWLRAQRTKNWTNGQEEGIRITLADNGIGMSPDVQKRVFAPFFTTKADVGTGIGLWITKCLIEERGGYVHFRSRQGSRSGTVMSFFLPSGLPAIAQIAAAAD